MATFLGIVFWIFLIFSILIIWYEIDAYMADGGGFVLIFFIWIVYGFLYIGFPVETTYEDVNEFHYKKTESGMHVMYGSHNQFTNDIYLIENIEDTSKVDIIYEEHFSSSGMKVGDNLKVKKK